jgi:C-terminal processing protease CtpA/Prc
LFFTKVADGFYISKVAAGFPAEGAGLQPGMVVTKVNGVELKAMSEDAARQMIAATPDPVTITIIGKGDVVLRRALPSISATSL